MEGLRATILYLQVLTKIAPRNPKNLVEQQAARRDLVNNESSNKAAMAFPPQDSFFSSPSVHYSFLNYTDSCQFSRETMHNYLQWCLDTQLAVINICNVVGDPDVVSISCLSDAFKWFLVKTKDV